MRGGTIVAVGSNDEIDPYIGSETREEALRSYTIQNAYAAFEEDVKGSLSPGKYADIVVLSKDILTVPAEEIREAKVVYTIVGGKVLYRGEGAPTTE